MKVSRCWAIVGLTLWLLLSGAIAQTYDHSWKDTDEERERWLITENAHMEVREQGMYCTMCDAASFRQMKALDFGVHSWCITEHWHEEGKGTHVYIQSCVDCGATSISSFPCKGEPCYHALSVSVQHPFIHEDTENCDHSWVLNSSYRQRVLSQGEAYYEQLMVCALCGEKTYKQVDLQ